MKYSGIGGQAVMEGVMMKNKNSYAVAVRKADKSIDVKVEETKSIFPEVLTKIPIIRGVFNFIESIIVGMSTITYSSEVALAGIEEEEKPGKFEQFLNRTFGDKAEKVILGFTVVLAIIMAIGIFTVIPFLISLAFKQFIDNYTIIALIEGVIRVTIFIVYVKLISMMEDIKRLFMYHGAEHKCINCVEHGLPLTLENVKNSSKQHKRCGTSFLLIVMVISILFFMFIRTDSPVLRLVLRLLLIPVIAGVSYEFLRLAGRTDNALINFLSKPGLWLQNLTTREPDDEMIEVGMASVEAVFDWRAYLKENFGLDILMEEEEKENEIMGTVTQRGGEAEGSQLS